MGDDRLRRVGLGAPNEERFGFVQVVSLADEGPAFASGQVGKDNTTGAMRPAAVFRDHAVNAAANLEEAFGLVGRRPGVSSCTVFVPGLAELGTGALGAVRGALGDRTAMTVVGVDALSSPDYRIEASAVAAGEEEQMTSSELIPWPGGTPVGAVGGVAGVAVGGVVHLAGHLAWNADGTLLAAGSTARQLAACYAAIDRTLAGAGLPPESLVAEHVFVVASPGGQLDFAAICDAHREATAGRRPASTLVPVASLAVPGALACVAAIAAGTPR